MASFHGGRHQLTDNSGNPLASGKVYFWEADGAYTTAKDTYSDPSLAGAYVNANPLIADSGGWVTAYLNGDYDVTIESSDAAFTQTFRNINKTASSDTESDNLIENNSFEATSSVDSTLPDLWTITEVGTVELDNSTQTHGLNSLKFTSTGSGGGNAVSANYYEVSDSRLYRIEFDIISSVVDVRNLVQVHWYDSAKTLISSTSVYDDSTTNPTSWASYSYILTPPSTSRYCKVQFWGCHTSDTTSGTTNYDNIYLGKLPFGTYGLYSNSSSATGVVEEDYHDSATPATNDVAAAKYTYWNNLSGTKTKASGIVHTIANGTASSEIGNIIFQTIYSGTYANRFIAGAGLYANGLSDPGNGNGNFNSVFKAGSEVYPAATDAETQTGTATNKAITPANFNASSLAWGQTWQTVARTSNTVYQNTTGRPIVLTAYSNNAAGNFTVYVENANPPTVAVNVTSSVANVSCSVTVEIPDDHYYKIVDNAGSRSGTFELR